MIWTFTNCSDIRIMFVNFTTLYFYKFIYFIFYILKILEISLGFLESLLYLHFRKKLKTKQKIKKRFYLAKLI